MFSLRNDTRSMVTIIEQESYEYERLRTYISRLLMFIGFSLLVLYITPILVTMIISVHQGLLSTKIYAETGEHLNLKTINPIPTDYWKRLFKPTYYDPGVGFFEQMQTQYQSKQNPIQQAIVDTAYSAPMSIDIPSLQIQGLRLTPNVSGDSEAEYNRALKKGAAHLKGTPLPGDGGNSIIYGHSGLPKLLGKYPDWLLFSKLEQISIGDIVTITRDGKQLTYKVTSKKIIDVNQLANFVQPTEKEQVTLVTCWPLGIGSRRLIVIAQRYGR